MGKEKGLCTPQIDQRIDFRLNISLYVISVPHSAQFI